jgi:hypothetical protein
VKRRRVMMMMMMRRRRRRSRMTPIEHDGMRNEMRVLWADRG